MSKISSSGDTPKPLKDIPTSKDILKFDSSFYSKYPDYSNVNAFKIDPKTDIAEINQFLSTLLDNDHKTFFILDFSGYKPGTFLEFAQNNLHMLKTNKLIFIKTPENIRAQTVLRRSNIGAPILYYDNNSILAQTKQFQSQTEAGIDSKILSEINSLPTTTEKLRNTSDSLSKSFSRTSSKHVQTEEELTKSLPNYISRPEENKTLGQLLTNSGIKTIKSSPEKIEKAPKKRTKSPEEIAYRSAKRKRLGFGITGPAVIFAAIGIALTYKFSPDISDNIPTLVPEKVADIFKDVISHEGMSYAAAGTVLVGALFVFLALMYHNQAKTIAETLPTSQTTPDSLRPLKNSKENTK